MAKLSNEDLQEIYYALETKVHRLKCGDYSDLTPGLYVSEWIAHLESIMEKIGEDGQNLDTEHVIKDMTNECHTAPTENKCPACGEENTFILAIDRTEYFNVYLVEPGKLRATYSGTEEMYSGEEDLQGHIRLFCGCGTYYKLPDDWDTL